MSDDPIVPARPDLLAAFYDQLSTKYDDATRQFLWTPPDVCAALLRDRVKASWTVLELGIGTGQSIGNLVSAGCAITGIDLSSQMLEQVKTKFPDVVLKLQSIETALLEAGSGWYDLIQCSGALEFVDDMLFVFREMKRALKSGGLALFTFEELIESHPIQRYRQSEMGRGASEVILELHRFPTYRRTINEVRKMLEKAGLKTVKAEPFQAYLKGPDLLPIFYWAVLASA